MAIFDFLQHAGHWQRGSSLIYTGQLYSTYKTWVSLRPAFISHSGAYFTKCQHF